MGTGATRHRTYLVMALEDELNVRLMEMVAYGGGIRYFCAGIEAAAAAAQRSGSCVTCRLRHHQSINSYFSNAGEDGWTVALPLLRHGDNYPRTYRESQSQRTPCSARVQFRASHSSDGHQRISSCEVGKIGIISYFESKYQRFIRWVERQALPLIYRILGWYSTPTQATQYCKPYIA